MTFLYYMENTSSTNQGDLNVCRSLQNEEWEVLESIYPDCVTSDLSSGIIKLEICVEFANPRTVMVIDDGSMREPIPSGFSSDHSIPSQERILSSLPPILLHLILPPNYPLHSPPEIVSLRATHSWFLRLPELRETLLGMWQAGEGILYNWVELIRNAEFLELQGDSIMRLPHPAPHLLCPLLTSHDLTTLTSRFSINTYDCPICLEFHKGARCLQLSCGHIFCRRCLGDFWQLYIREGDVSKVGCADPECVNAGREAGEEDVARIVTPEELRRWRWLRNKIALEKDPGVIHCPLSFCQASVPKPQGLGDEESGWSRLRICQSCGYSFCSFCKRTWHGPLSNCPISATESLVSEYMNLDENSVERVRIERQYGKAVILRLLAKYEEEKSNTEWFKSSTMPCPGCRVNVEKSIGCNHMTCAKCRQHFCYRCGTKIDASNPYKHFNIPGTSCWMKLFDFQQENNEWQPAEGFDIV